MSDKLNAIVLKSNDRKEKDVNILLFSIEKGKFWATLKGVKGDKAKMKLAKNPFCFGEFVVEEGKTGYIVTGFEPIETFHELSEDIDKYFEAFAALEIVDVMEFSGQNERAKVFVLLVKVLKSLCFGKIHPLYVLDKFLLEIFDLEGFPLNPEKCSGCGDKNFERLFIDYSVGELQCIACKSFGSVELSKGIISTMRLLYQTPFEKLSSLKLASETEFGLLKVLTKDFEARFDKNLKMMGILS